MQVHVARRAGRHSTLLGHARQIAPQAQLHDLSSHDMCEVMTCVMLLQGQKAAG